MGIALRDRDNAVRSLEYETKQIRKKLGDINFIEHAERERASWESDKKYIEDMQKDLCELLGLPAGSRKWDIRHALDLQKDMLKQDGQIKEVQKSLTAALKALKKQTDDLERLSVFAGLGDAKP